LEENPAMDPSPSHFYRYRSLSESNALLAKYVEKTICGHGLFFPAPALFNDPFDCRPPFSFAATDDEKRRYLKRLTRKFSSSEGDRNQRRTETKTQLTALSEPEVHRMTQAANVRTLTQNIGVLCLSEIRDDILMWSHYADSHRGLCLEFDGSYEFFARAQPITYKSERPTINAFRDSLDKMVIEALLTKAQHWSYEKEWRVIDHATGPGVYRFPAAALTGIILGAQIPDKVAATVAGWIKRRATPVRLFRASVHPKKYSLVIDDITAES
jgi:hypothetical protein